jgi:hypothetical protein
MSRLHQFIFAGVTAVAFQLHAQTPPLFPGPTGTNLNLVPPPMPKLPSPVNFFRQLLAMSPVERLAALTNRPPEARAKILTKVREYQALGPDERELRLRATELRWYLTPLLRVPPTERAARLANVPEELRGLVQSRLQQWDILPPPLQQEFLASAPALHYFARLETTNQTATTPAQEKIGKQFNQFFELTPVEKQQTLKTLSAAERAQMEKTLQTFDKLPPKQRFTCLRNYAKFAGMNATERAEFLKNAESWSKMSPKERQTWRDLVAQVPQWPPMPPATVPPNLIPHMSPKIPRPSVATNLN